MKELTVIIPFLNEGIEVERTLDSLFEHTKEDLDIILINDCSDDGYDYIGISKKYKTKYIKNKKRCGVAQCRNIGIEASETEYFLLLDAHMRFYDHEWYTVLIRALKLETTTLFCLQSKVLLNICGIIKENKPIPAYGAFLEMNPTVENFLNVSWNTKCIDNLSDKRDSNTLEIPCVLGAGYACNKQYWNSLHGLTGLRNYGLDEQFISLKIWLSGGKCKLISNIVLGHIYRQIAPYHVSNTDILYNKLLLTRILLPDSYAAKYETFLENSHTQEFEECKNLLRCNENLIIQERRYFEGIRRRSLNDFLRINNEAYFVPNASNWDFEQTLAYILTNTTTDIGIFNGKAGIAFIYMLLARKEQKTLYEFMADMTLQSIWNSCTTETPISFSKGLLGIGWLCEFLHQNHMIIGNPDEILKDLDDMVNAINPIKYKDTSFDTGIAGIVAYVYARCTGCKIRRKNIPFDEHFLNSIIKTAKNIFNDDSLKEINYVQNINTRENELTKKDIVNLIHVSLYKSLPICTCIEKLLYEDRQLK